MSVVKSKKIIITGGATGGHLFPAISIASEFENSLKSQNSQENQDCKKNILFITTGKSFEQNILSKLGYRFESIKTEGLKGYDLKKKILSIIKILFGVVKAINIIKRFKPTAIIAVGSYLSVPVVLAGWLLRKKIILQEQNFIAGISNKFLSHFADFVCVSFKDTKINCNLNKIKFTGNPVRQEFINYINSLYQDNRENINNINNKNFTVLILGGSQGAKSLNKAIINNIKYLNQKENLFFIHQTGYNSEFNIENIYKSFNISYLVKPFFENMPNIYAQADLIICRAGASSISEICLLGKPAILIPYPFAADNHQALNALYLVKNKSAELIYEKNLTANILAEKINFYFENQYILKNMGKNAKKLAKPNASKDIIKLI